MAGSYCKILLIGHCGKEPESRFTPSGDQVAEFSMAVSERRRGQDGQQQEQTTWYRVSAWGKLAEVVEQYVRKGSYLFVEGPLTAREYTTRDGQARTSLEVRAREVKLLDKRGDNDQAQGQQEQRGGAAGGQDTDAYGDLPF